MAQNMEVTGTQAPLRILYVITKANWGGAQRYVYDLALAAHEAGHEVLVVSGSIGPLTERLAEAGIAVRTITAMKRDIALADELRSFLELLRIARDFAPDVIHGNSSKAGALAALAGRLIGTQRIVFTAHGWAFNEARPKWQKALIGIFHYATVLLSHVTLCVSGTIRQDAAWMPFTKSRFALVRNGVETVAPVPRDDARARLAPGLAAAFPGALWIGTVAELHPTKGLDTLIGAFARLPRTADAPVLVIIGDGTEWHRLQKLVQIHDLAGRVVLAGFVEDAARYLSAFDLFAFASRSEALGYALLEAGLARLPAVATRVGGIPEIVVDGVSGLLVPADDAKALARALETLIEDAALRARLAEALHAHVREGFSIERMTRETLAAYRSR